MADAHNFQSNAIVDERQFEKLAFVDDGFLTPSELDPLRDSGSHARIRWEGYWAIAAIIALAVLPVFWLFRWGRNMDRPD